MNARRLIEASFLAEISLAPRFDGAANAPESDDGPVDAAQGADWAQEEAWWSALEGAGMSIKDLRRTATKYGLEKPRDAIDAAEAGEGFPRRGSWSGELVWLFLTLRDAKLVDNAGRPAGRP